MSGLTRGVVMLGLLAFGYVLGANHVLHLASVQAQNEEELKISDETRKKIQAANESLKSAGDDLKEADLDKPAIKGLNSFAILVGGVNAIEDLETGRGVDPVTFAGLYAGEAVDEIAEHLTFDEEGRLTYKNRVVRMYPISRLKKLYARRLTLATE